MTTFTVVPRGFDDDGLADAGVLPAVAAARVDRDPPEPPVPADPQPATTRAASTPATTVIRLPRCTEGSPLLDVVFTVSVELPSGRSTRGRCIHAPIPDDGGSRTPAAPRNPLGVFRADSRPSGPTA